MTGRNGRQLVDTAVEIEHLDEHGLRVAFGYLLGASVRSIAVRRALRGALDAAVTAQANRGSEPW